MSTSEEAVFDAARKAIADLGSACELAAKKQRRYAELWNRTALVLGLPAAVLAAVAGVAAFADLAGGTAAGVFALVSAAFSAAVAYFGGDRRAKEARERARAYGALADTALDYVNVHSLDPHRQRIAPDLLADLRFRLDSFRNGQPLPEPWSRGMPTVD